jgi:hypothetical protein
MWRFLIGTRALELPAGFWESIDAGAKFPSRNLLSETELVWMADIPAALLKLSPNTGQICPQHELPVFRYGSFDGYARGC